MGIYVFPSKDKTPMCAVWQRADTSITPEQRDAERLKFEERNGYPPPHIGSTVDPKVIERLWRQFEDAVPSISCGPSNLYVVDADFAEAKDGKRAKNGPVRLNQYLAENEIAIEGAVVINTQSGGKHVYFKNPLGLDSKAGALRDLDCDVRGVGGQTVAPGAIRVDGKEYKITTGAFEDLIDLPDVPEGIVSAVRTSRESTEVKDEVVAASIAKLEDTDIQPFEYIFDPIIGSDIETLRKKDQEFDTLYRKGVGDISRNRFKITKCLMREWPNMPIERLLSFYEGWSLDDGEPGAGTFNDGSSEKGAGEYNYRDIAREHAKGPNEHRVSDGGTFGDLTTNEATLAPSQTANDDSGDLPPEQKLIKETKAKAKLSTMMRAEKLYASQARFPVDMDLDQLPPQQFVYYQYLELDELAIVTAGGGRGKSVWMLRKVLLFNAEDSLVAMKRRAAAYMKLHDFTAEMRQAVQDNLVLISGTEAELMLAEMDGNQVRMNEGDFEGLERIIRDHGIEVLMLDPLIALHRLPENGNVEMGARLRGS
jgi:hypothetical protein